MTYSAGGVTVAEPDTRARARRGVPSLADCGFVTAPATAAEWQPWIAAAGYLTAIPGFGCGCPGLGLDGFLALVPHVGGCAYAGRAQVLDPLAMIFPRLPVGIGTAAELGAGLRGCAEDDLMERLLMERADTELESIQRVHREQRQRVESMLAAAAYRETREAFFVARQRLSGADFGALCERAVAAGDPDRGVELVRAAAGMAAAVADPEGDALYSMTPGLRTVAEAAAASGAGADGVLAAVLARVAVRTGPHVRLPAADGSRPPGGGGSLNFYSALIGGPSSGKSLAMGVAERLIPLPEGEVLPEGTAEGVIKTYAFMRREKVGDSDFRYVREVMAERLLIQADEVDSVFAEMARQGSKWGPFLRSGWVGALAGTTAGTMEARTFLPPHSYRFGTIFGCQASATAPLFAEGDRGTPQRFLWLAATRVRISGLAFPAPPRLGFEPPPGVIPDMGADQPIRWMDWPPAAAAHVAAESLAMIGADPYAFAAADEDRTAAMLAQHATLLRLKICALLAILDGLEQPTDTHWAAAGVIMDRRAACVRATRRVADTAAAAETGLRGRTDGQRRAAAKRAEAAADADFAADMEARIIVCIGQLRERDGKNPQPSYIRQRAGKQYAPHVYKALGWMISRGDLGVDEAGGYYLIFKG